MENPKSLDELRHVGVKGMKWGVRKKYEPVKGSSSTKTPDASQIERYSKETSRIHKELSRRGRTELDTALMKSKYETPPDKEPTSGLTKGQKTAIGVGVGVGVLAIAAIGANVYLSKNPEVVANLNSKVKAMISNQIAADAKESLLKNPQLNLDKVRNRAYSETIDGLKLNWDSGVNLQAGSILKRVSSKAEKEIRSGGFFASFRDEDLESYKAILPSFWPHWGVGDPTKGGFINHYKASEAVRAPSGKETISIFKDLLANSSSFSSYLGFTKETPHTSLSDESLQSVFKAFSLSWARDLDIPSSTFFKEVKAKGYNSLIDFNDAGTLGKTPLRLLDSSIFEIVKNESLSFEDMLSAAASWSPNLLHALLIASNYTRKEGLMSNKSLDELRHAGVKGMKWGVRKEPKTTDADIKAARKEVSSLNEEAYGAYVKSHNNKYDRETGAIDKRTFTARDKKIQSEIDEIAERYNSSTALEIANKATRGEKAVAAMNLTLMGITAVGIGAYAVSRR